MKFCIQFLALLLIIRAARPSVTMRHLSTDAGTDDHGSPATHNSNEDYPEEGHQEETDHGEEDHDDHEESDYAEEEEHSQEEEHTQEEIHETLQEVPDALTVAENTEDELEKNYRKIAADLQLYEDAYKLCIDNIKDIHYDTSTVDECVGENYNFLIDDIYYIKRKLIAQAERTLRGIFLSDCYKAAGNNLETGEACDLIEQDAIRLLRHEIDFPLMLAANRAKYENLYAKLEPDFFDNLMMSLKPVQEEMDKLLEELYDHRLLTIAKVRQHIDDRTARVKIKYQGGSINSKPKVKRTKMVITSQLVQPPHYHINLSQLPRPVLLNGTPKTYAVDSNPYVEKWLNNVGPKRFSEVNTPNVQVKGWQPSLAVSYADSKRKDK